MDAAFTQFSNNLAGSIGLQIEALSFWGNYYGVTPMVYEAGPDIQLAPALQIEIATDPRIQGVVSALFSKIFQSGVKLAQAFQTTPSAFIENNAQGAWGFQQTITDSFTNFKMLGLLSMLTQAESYTNSNGTFPCSFPVANIKTSDGASKNLTNPSFPSGMGILYFGATGTRDLYWHCCANDVTTDNFALMSTDSATGTLATITVIANGVATVQGTVTLPHGGAGNSSSCAISASTTLAITVPKGASCIEVSFATGQGAVPGITALVPV